MSSKNTANGDWVTQIADRAIRRYETTAGSGSKVVVASGLSPSGPIHLGNLRELMVPHYVADEIKRRGVPCEHILSWDDYDRFRKVPVGVPTEFDQYIGRPLTSVPDPEHELESWADRFKGPIRQAMDRLGLEIREISQTEMYKSGAYLQQIIKALRSRKEIDDLLGKYRTLPGAEDHSDDDDDGVAGDQYWPYTVYCHQCERDFTEITAMTDAGTDDTVELSYRCIRCGHDATMNLADENRGKLVWKVDWPMRWAYEGVTFEAAGADHSSPGSSFTVGSELVSQIYRGQAPNYTAYSFVGGQGSGKLSSSTGGVPTPSDALEVLEVPILRWMYARKSPRQSISVDLSGGVPALYDEWDSLTRKVQADGTGGSQKLAYVRACRTESAGEFARPQTTMPFRTLASAIGIAAGDAEQTTRIVSELGSIEPEQVPTIEPRLSLARTWVRDYAPEQDRIVVRNEPDQERLASLSETESSWLDLLITHLEDDWTLDGCRALVYGVPKLALGLPADTDPTAELKTQQRAFFRLLYNLFLGSDTGPRLPTLLMALGASRVRTLVGQ